MHPALSPLFSFLVFFVLSVGLPAQPFHFAQAPDTPFDLTEHAFLLADTSLDMGWPEAKRHFEKGSFQPLANFPWGRKYERGKLAYWLAIEINTEGLAQAGDVIMAGLRKDHVDFFLFENGPPISKGRTGAKYAEADLPGEIPIHAFGDFPLHFQPGKNYLLLVRLRSWLGFHVPFRPALYAPAKRAQELSGQSFSFFVFHGLFFGVLVFMGVFTLLQFAQNRNRAYLWYACYLFSILLFYLREFNNYNPFFRVLPLPLSEHEWYMPMAFGQYFFYVLFVNAFLDAKEKLPVLYRLSKRLLLSMAAFMVLERVVVFTDPYLAWEMTTYARLVFLFFGFYFLFLIAKSLDGLAKYILAGTLLLMLSNLVVIAISYFNSSHLWGVWDYSHIPAFVGVLLEILLFSTGLGYKSRRMEAEKIQAEEKAKRLSEMDGMKNRLFTNITHEFRTPLTVIIGMADGNEGTPKHRLRERFELIKRNGQNLLTLVNQMLDLTKLEAGKLQPRPVQDDVIGFLKVLVESFHSHAHSLQTGLQFYSEKEALVMDFDPDQLQRIVTNLLSNAFKFTPAYGKILVLAKAIEENGQPLLELKVRDTGTGIPEVDLPRIFDRFYQADSGDARMGEGTGIGLALVKELAGAAGGSVSVESKQGNGSTFTVLLPIENKCRLREALADVFPTNGPVDKNENPPSRPMGDLPSVLLIEDNADVVTYLRTCLEDEWEVHHAYRGGEGIDRAFELVPDLILCDVMMPGMSGLEVCEKLKSDVRTSHIPLLMLTAKSTQADRMEGLSKGADAYLIKPFEKEELLLRLENLLRLRQNLRAHLEAGQNGSGGQAESAEQQFLQKVKTTIDGHLDDESFGAAQLCHAVGLSRVQLHRKLKALTNLSTSVYIRNYRLHRAKHLLETTDLNVSEVVYQTGFGNLSWFSQAFKETFGYSPSETRK